MLERADLADQLPSSWGSEGQAFQTEPPLKLPLVQDLESLLILLTKYCSAQLC